MHHNVLPFWNVPHCEVHHVNLHPTEYFLCLLAQRSRYSSHVCWCKPLLWHLPLTQWSDWRSSPGMLWEPLEQLLFPEDWCACPIPELIYLKLLPAPDDVFPSQSEIHRSRGGEMSGGSCNETPVSRFSSCEYHPKLSLHYSDEEQAC